MFSCSARRYAMRCLGTAGGLHGRVHVPYSAVPSVSSATVCAPQGASSLLSVMRRPYSTTTGGTATATPEGQTAAGQQPGAEEKATATPADDNNTARAEKTEQARLLQLVKDKDERIAEIKSQLAYALADAENARKVAAEDVKKAKDFGIKDFATDMIEVVDVLESAAKQLAKLSPEDKERMKNVSTGIEMTLAMMMKNLERSGVSKIQLKVGDVFDPNWHEALFNHPIKADDQLKEGQVAVVVKTGYKIMTRTLRPSQVGVAQVQKE